jgi:hypothetical protein
MKPSNTVKNHYINIHQAHKANNGQVHIFLPGMQDKIQYYIGEYQADDRHNQYHQMIAGLDAAHKRPSEIGHHLDGYQHQQVFSKNNDELDPGIGIDFIDLNTGWPIPSVW